MSDEKAVCHQELLMYKQTEAGGGSQRMMESVEEGVRGGRQRRRESEQE